MNRLHTLLFPLLAALLVAGPVAPLPAQESGDARSAPVLGARDAYAAGGAIVATAALTTLDERVALAARDSLRQRSRPLRLAAGGLNLLGVPGTVLVAGGLYLGGRLMDSPGAARAGVRAGEAIVVAEVLTYGVKVLAGRARPRASPDDPRDFGFMRGLRGGEFRSFPSGHTAAAFATATVLAGEISDRDPGSHAAAAALYGTATLVGASRLYHDEHWLSDIAMGGAVGIYGGLKVREYHRERGETRIDRWLLTATVSGGRLSSISLLPLLSH